MVGNETNNSWDDEAITPSASNDGESIDIGFVRAARAARKARALSSQDTPLDIVCSLSLDYFIEENVIATLKQMDAMDVVGITFVPFLSVINLMFSSQMQRKRISNREL